MAFLHVLFFIEKCFDARKIARKMTSDMKKQALLSLF